MKTTPDRVVKKFPPYSGPDLNEMQTETHPSREERRAEPPAVSNVIHEAPSHKNSMNALAEAAATMRGSKPGLKTSELWLVLVSGGAITEIAMREGGMTWQQAIGCACIALMVSAYSLSRALAKKRAE